MAGFYDLFPGEWLKAAMLKGKEQTVKVVELQHKSVLKPNGKTEDAWVLYFDKTEKGLGLNRTNARLLFALLGEDTEDWIGRWVTLAAEKDGSGMSDDGLCIRVVGSPELKQALEVTVKGAMGAKVKRVLRPTKRGAAPEAAPEPTVDANGEVHDPEEDAFIASLGAEPADEAASDGLFGADPA